MAEVDVGERGIKIWIIKLHVIDFLIFSNDDNEELWVKGETMKTFNKKNEKILCSILKNTSQMKMENNFTFTNLYKLYKFCSTESSNKIDTNQRTKYLK